MRIHPIGLSAKPVLQDWHALSFASPALRHDYRMALCTVKRCGLALEILEPSMRNDRALVLMAVQEDRGVHFPEVLNTFLETVENGLGSK